MSLLYRMIDSVIPLATEGERRQARSRALAAASPGDWLSVALRHHQQVEAAFHAVTAGTTPQDRRVALQELARVLVGHAIAEESVLYPALARCGERKHAEHAYADQADFKIQMASLEQLAPMSREFIAQIERLRLGLIQHHFEEEAHWFIELLQGATAEEHRVLTQRFQQEFDRYVCSDELISVLEGIQVPESAPAQSCRESSCS